MDDISQDPYFEQPDLGILINLGFCLSVSVPLFIAYCVLRKRIFRLYDANIVYRDRSRIAGLHNGVLSWIKPTLFMEDKHLLLLIGLDGFVYLKSLKLLMIIMIFFGMTSLFTLWPTYFFNHSTSANYYVRSCIRNVKNESFLWVPLLVITACTIFIFYAVYLFFKNIVVYRQAYLKSPSTFQALNKIETYTGRLRSFSQCITFLDASSKSIVVSGIASTYTTERIKAIFGDMRFRDVQSVFIAKDRSLIVQKLKRLNGMHEKLEKLYHKFYKKLLEEAENECPNIEAELEKIDISTLGSDEIRRLRVMADSAKFYPELREDWKTKAGEVVDAIEYLSRKLVNANVELNDLVYHYIHDSDSASLEPIAYSPNNGFAEDPSLYDSLTDIVSFRALARIGQNINDFKLTLWGTSSSAVIVFEDWKSATIASQTLLSSRPFSFAVQPAPLVTEIDWDSFNMPRADRTLRNFLGDLLFVVINVFFSIFVAMFASLLDIQVLERALPFLKPLLKDSPKLRESIMGILGPLSLNIIFAIIPYILLVLTYYQAHIDKAEVQLAIMNKYSWLLFIQTFVVALAGPVQEIFKAVLEQNYAPLLEKLDKKAAQTSAIFLNLILQKAFIGLVLILAKPVDLLFAFVRRIRPGNLTAREKRSLNKPAALPLGFLYPEYAVIVFQICLSFGFITPIIITAGILFFTLSYFIFRAQLIFADKIPHETGGVYWSDLSIHIVFALIMAQFFTLIQFISLKGRLQAFLLAPVIGASLFGMLVMRRRFRRRTSYIALSGEFQEAAHRLIRVQNELREKIIDRAYLESTLENSSDEIPTDPVQEQRILRSARTFDTFHIHADSESAVLDPDDAAADGISVASQKELLGNPYSNPVLLQRLRTLMLPKNFFALLLWLQEHPKQDPAPPV